MERGNCAYCGEWREMTRDHIPPRTLFSKPRPNDLITVPSCADCNRDACKDDEYFRIAITTGINPEKFPKELADSIRAIKSLARSGSLGFAISVLKSFDLNTGGLTIDRARIEAVLFRITRGLFYHHKNLRLPETVTFQCRLVDSTTEMHVEGRARFDRLTKQLKTVGPGVFRYAFEAYETPEPYGNVWLFRFYDHRTFFCVTVSEETMKALELKDKNSKP